MSRMERRTGLGRGLASLIPDSVLDVDSSDEHRPIVRLVPLDEIEPNPDQPRKVFNPEELNSLAGSIRLHGVMSPLVVRREEGRYVLIAGERRLRASALAGLSEVPVLVREVDGVGAQLELALVENLQRTDLDPIEAARGYHQLKEVYGLTQDAIARKVGKERSTVANALRLLKLPDVVLRAIREGQISAGHARALLPLADDSHELNRVLARIISRELSVRKTEQWVAELVRIDPSARASRRQERNRTLEYATVELTKSLGTSVAIRPRKRGGGRIVIDYADAEDLDRLITQLRGQD